jgi:hypothetical protein
VTTCPSEPRQSSCIALNTVPSTTARRPLALAQAQCGQSRWRTAGRGSSSWPRSPFSSSTGVISVRCRLATISHTEGTWPKRGELVTVRVPSVGVQLPGSSARSSKVSSTGNDMLVSVTLQYAPPSRTVPSRQKQRQSAWGHGGLRHWEDLLDLSRRSTVIAASPPDTRVGGICKALTRWFGDQPVLYQPAQIPTRLGNRATAGR